MYVIPKTKADVTYSVNTNRPTLSDSTHHFFTTSLISIETPKFTNHNSCYNEQISRLLTAGIRQKKSKVPTMPRVTVSYREYLIQNVHLDAYILRWRTTRVNNFC
jgi:hypothetical protein